MVDNVRHVVITTLCNVTTYYTLGFNNAFPERWMTLIVFFAYCARKSATFVRFAIKGLIFFVGLEYSLSTMYNDYLTSIIPGK